jgi:hypothetical protein
MRPFQSFNNSRTARELTALSPELSYYERTEEIVWYLRRLEVRVKHIKTILVYLSRPENPAAPSSGFFGVSSTLISVSY